MNGREWVGVFRNKKFLTVLVLEFLLLLAGVVGLFIPTIPIDVFAGQENISLSPGVYNIELEYYASAEECVFGVKDMNPNGTNSILFNDFLLKYGDNTENCQLWVLHRTDWGKVEVVNTTGAVLDIRNIRIQKTNAGSRIWIFGVICGSIVLDFLMGFYLYDKIHTVPMKRKVVWGTLVLTIALISIPSLTDYNIWGHDWGFHLLRVEGLLSGWKDGQFPVRIQGNWMKGFGYAVSIFYSDLFLVIPAIFRLIGFPIYMSNNLFQIVINIATVVVSYKSFKRCFQNETAALAGTVAYATAAYRIYDVYMRAALGEVLAMIFLPVIFCGFYCLFTQSTDKKDYKKNMWVLVAGFTGVIQSHVLTCEMLLFVLVPICLVLWKKLIRKETFFLLLKAAGITVLANLWYLVPFIDYFVGGDFHVSHIDTLRFTSIQEWGTMPAHLLFLFYGRGSRAQATNFSMCETGSFGVGAVLLASVFVWAYLEFAGKSRRIQSQERWACRILFWQCIALFVLSSCYFPWNKLQAIGGVAERIVLSIQFPYRFLSLACIASAALLGLIIRELNLRGTKALTNYVGWLVVCTACIFASYQTSQILMNHGFARVYEKQGLGTMDVGNGEYLPYRTEIWQFMPNTIKSGEDVSVGKFEKEMDGLQLEFDVINRGEDSYVEVPLLYYKGYHAVDADTKEGLRTVAGDNNLVRVMLPEGYNGKIHVFFKGFWYWRVAELISVVTMLSVLAWRWRQHKTVKPAVM